MKQFASLINYLFKFAVVGLALAFVATYFWPAINGSEPEVTQVPNTQSNPNPASANARVDSYAEAVNRAAPAVVSIYTRTPAPQINPLLQRFMDGRVTRRTSQGLGSGVILSDDGYILTNYHVIRNAERVSVGLWDGRIAAPRLVGIDLPTDLALLKIDLNNLPSAIAGDSKSLRVGDVVLAIGNALGLSHTVTMGIVSATGRNEVSGGLFQDPIQTDAAISRGNSGGALINTAGEIVGINTSQLNPGQGSSAISFAIPIDLAQTVMNQIIDYGSVKRGWLGASFSNLPFNRLQDGSVVLPGGVVVNEVPNGTPAWEAGLQTGDVILMADGEPVTTIRDFLFQIAQIEPGTEVELEVIRNEQQFTTRAALIQQPPLTNF